MEESGWTGKTITLKYKLDTFQGTTGKVVLLRSLLTTGSLVFTRAKSFDRWISTKKEDLYAVSPSFFLTIK